MKDLLHTFAQEVPGSVQGCPCTYPSRQIELFQIFLVEFQKFFLFWLAGLILEALDVELEAAISFGI